MNKLVEACDNVEDKIEVGFDWLNSDGQTALKCAVVGATLIGLIMLGAWGMV